MLGSGPPEHDLTGRAWPNQRPLPFQPPARERPSQDRPTPTGLQSPLSGRAAQRQPSAAGAANTVNRPRSSPVGCTECWAAAPRARPDRTGLGEPANPFIPTACLWTLSPKLRPTPTVSRRGRQHRQSAQILPGRLHGMLGSGALNRA